MTTSPERSFFARWRRRLARGLLLLLFMAVIAASLTLLNLWREHRRGVRDAEAAEARLDETDPGWRWADLNSAPVPPPERDAFAILRNMTSGFGWSDELSTTWRGQDARPDTPHMPAESNSLAEINATLSRLTPQLETVRKLAGATGGEFDLDDRPKPGAHRRPGRAAAASQAPSRTAAGT